MQIGEMMGQSALAQHVPGTQPPPQHCWPNGHCAVVMHDVQLWFVQAAPPQSAGLQQLPAKHAPLQHFLLLPQSVSVAHAAQAPLTQVAPGH